MDAAWEHLAAELARLDLLLHREILRLRARYHLSLDEFRGLYISDEQVDALITGAMGDPGGGAPEALTAQAKALRTANARRFGGLPWHRLVTAFGLTEADQDLLLVALAPELDAKYETVYAYLNNDVTRRLPTVELALRLLAAEASARAALRVRLSPTAPLLAGGLLRLLDTEGPASSLARRLAVAPPVVDAVLGQPPHDPLLMPAARLPVEAAWAAVQVDEDVLAALRRLLALLGDDGGPAVVLEGPPGAGRREAARAVSASLGLPLYELDLGRLPPDTQPAELDTRLGRHRRLGPCAVLVAGLGAAQATGSEGGPTAAARAAFDSLAGTPGPLFLASEPGDPWPELLGPHRGILLPLRCDQREAAWRRGLAAAGTTATDATVRALADRFAITPGQIRQAVRVALDARLVAAGDDGPLPEDLLFAAARERTDRPIIRLAVKVPTDRFTWEDLVLTAATERQVRAVVAAVRGQRRVYGAWGMRARVAGGLGVKALFAGPPGTGKTMTAAVLARDLGLDLYKIDLSAVVSKYIGETEKNLDRIFAAARGSNAILFFDEADALFGKRSQVSDAHDRYANIEVAYLLQALEEHEGVVILASNARKHIDEAFARRLHYVIEYPLPDEALRERLWQGIYPPTVPLDDNVDLGFLARQFAISGGDIRNVALDAAFLSASDGPVITMRHLVVAMARQSIKLGRIPSATEFRQYHPWVTQDVWEGLDAGRRQ
jgi:MoxR-like ATPase